MIKSIVGIAFDCLDANDLADFYVKITGWEKEISSDDWAGIRTPCGILLVFQTVKNYKPPVWPWKENEQQQMAHIDFLVDNLLEAEEHALACGAKKAEEQYHSSSSVMIDPAGHPFCLTSVQQ